MDGGTVKRDSNGKPVSQRGGVPLTDRTCNPVIASGPMGSGKTQLLYATLFDQVYGYTHSAVLWDYKRVMCDEVGKAREAMGQDVIIVDITKRGAGRVNPMQWVREGDRFVADIQLIAAKVTEREANGSGKSAHWINATFSYMSGVIAYLLTAAPDSEKCLAGVRRHMLRGDAGSKEMMRDGIDTLAVEAAQELWSISEVWEPEEDEEEDFAEMDDKSAAYRKAIYTTASAMLADFADDVLATQTAVSDFDPSDLVSGEKPLTVIISTMPSDARRLRRVYGLIWTQIVDQLTEDIKSVRGMPRCWDVLLGIDEFLEFKIEEVSSWVKYLREYHVRPLFLAQTFESVLEQYQRVMASSAAWVAFAPMSVFEADLMSRMIGDRDEVVASQSKTRRVWYEPATITESTRIERRPEKPASDLMDMDPDELFIFGFGGTINAQRVFAFLRYPDLYGPASRAWKSPVSSNPWLGKFIPVPPPPPPKPKKRKETAPKEENGNSETETAAPAKAKPSKAKSLLKGINK
jgi:type IV secretion system protein VirD4